MRSLLRRLAVACPVLTLSLLAAAPASAHERWFVEDTPGGDWGFFFTPLPLLLVTAVVAVTVAWRWVAVHVLPAPELRVLRPLARLTPYVPRLLAIHLGVSLLALAATGDFLAHSLPLSTVPGGDAVGLLEAALGVWFITGVRLRPAAVLVSLLGPLALLASGPVAVLESAHLLGVAVFVAVLPPSDGAFGRVEIDLARQRPALLALRLGAATALVTLAFSEKFTNPALAHATLERYPALNVADAVGITLSNDTFTAVAGATELLFGLLVLSGALPQVAVLVAAVPFNATLLLFGQTELVGHLPVYGIFLALIVYGSDARTARTVRWLPSPASVLDVVRPRAHRLAEAGSGDA